MTLSQVFYIIVIILPQEQHERHVCDYIVNDSQCLKDENKYGGFLKITHFRDMLGIFKPDLILNIENQLLIYCENTMHIDYA